MLENKPEGLEAVQAEGHSLEEALSIGARRLELNPGEVEYRLDLDHFRNDMGRSVGMDTVKIWVWPKNREVIAAAGDATSFIEELLNHMGFSAKVDIQTREQEKRAKIRINTEYAARIVGKRGATLDAVKELLLAHMKSEHHDWDFILEVPDRRERRRDGPERAEEPRRNARPSERHARGRKRSSERSNSREPRVNEDRVVRMVRKVARRVISKGEPELIRKELNSFARRIVHVTIANEFDDLTTESIGDGPVKRVKVLPRADKSVESNNTQIQDENRLE